MGDAVAVTVTCPTCGSVWETTSRSGRTRCPNRHRVYVPAATRSASRASSPREAPRAPTSAPVPATTTGRTDTRGDDTRPTVARRSRRAVPYASSAPVQSARPDLTTPASVRAAIGASGMWRCGHVATLVSATTAREPAASRCRECGATGIIAQLTPTGWAPVAVEDAPPEQARAETGRRPSRPVVPPRFAGSVSPSAWSGETGWQPVEDRRPHAPADLVAVPRLRSPGVTQGRRDVVAGTYPGT